MAERIDVFISSTSRDLEKHREAVRDVVLRLGMHPIIMEAFNPTDCNALQLCYEKVQQAEIFIGIYAHRYGYAPGPDVMYTLADGTVKAGDGETSITHWEYLWALERGLPIRLFVIGDTDADGKPLAWPLVHIEDEPGKSRLKAFKAQIGKNHVWREFHSPDSLAAQVATALAELKAEIQPAEEKSAPAPDADVQLPEYLDWLCDGIADSLEGRFVELEGDAQRLKAVRRHDDYEALFEAFSVPLHADHCAPDSDARSHVENVREKLLGVERGVLVGEPGSGKTWMLKRLTLDYADILQGRRPAERRLIPALVYLNQFKGERDGQKWTFAQHVQEALGTLAPLHEALLAQDRLVVLCDALNEMPRRCALDGRDLLAEVRVYLKRARRFVVSCRVRDYRDDLGELKPLEQVYLRDLELPAIRELVVKRLGAEDGGALWAAMGGSDRLLAFWETAQRAGHGEAFWEPKTNWWKLKNIGFPPDAWRAMHNQRGRLIPLARNPFMGFLLCGVYSQNRGDLPRSRAALFGGFVTLLIRRETHNAQQRGETFPAQTDLEAALVALARALQEQGVTVIPRASAAVDGGLLDAAVSASLLADDGQTLRFTHQLLQEYFAARILLEALEADESAARFFGADWWEAGVWRETTVMLGEFLGEGARGANRVAHWLADVTPEVALEVITRSNAGLTLADVEDDTRTALLASARGKSTETDPRGRAAAWRVLGLLDADDRPGVGVIAQNGVTLPDIAWCEIPAEKGGETFVFGEGEDEQRLAIPDTYWIAKYPVTYAQYAAFVDAGGYGRRDCWTGAGWAWKGARAEPEYGWRDPTWHIANHPVIGVTWYEAYAFCQWLDRVAPKPAPGLTIRLATEAEWEKAARYPDGRAYPWGPAYSSGYANIDETTGKAGPHDLQRTTPVGMYPQGANPAHGAHDLSGNVWEWCLSKQAAEYTFPEDNDPEGDAWRVLRGGSWGLNHNHARAAYRHWSSPNLRYDPPGFRVVCGAAPSLLTTDH